MAYINNYLEPIEMAQGATSTVLALPDGSYRLTLSDALRTRWEIVDAVVVSGAATLTRAREGTADQLWPGGSVIYCAVTAGQLNALLTRIAEAEARIAALEQGGGAGALTDEQGQPLTDAGGNILTTGD